MEINFTVKYILMLVFIFLACIQLYRRYMYFKEYNHFVHFAENTHDKFYRRSYYFIFIISAIAGISGTSDFIAVDGICICVMFWSQLSIDDLLRCLYLKYFFGLEEEGNSKKLWEVHKVYSLFALPMLNLTYEDFLKEKI